MRHFREVGDDGMAINVLAERDGNARLAVAPFVGFEQIAHDDFRLNQIGNFDTDRRFSGNRREDVNAFRLERGGKVVGQALDFFQLHARRGMQFITRDGRAFRDVAEGNFDVELRQRRLHEPRVGHEFFLGLGRLDCHVRVLKKIKRGQLVIPDHRHTGDGHRLGLARRELRTRRNHRRDRRGGFDRNRAIGNGNDRLRFGFVGVFRRNFFGGSGRFGFFYDRFFRRFGFASENFIRRGRFDFASGYNFADFQAIGGGSNFLRRLRHGGLAIARTFGLRITQVAHGGFRHGQTVGTQTAGGFLNFLNFFHAPDFLFEFALLFFQFERPFFQGDFLSGLEFTFWGGFFLLQDRTNPVAQLKIGQEQKTDQTQCGINNRRAESSEQAEAVVVLCQPSVRQVAEPATGEISIDARAPIVDQINPSREMQQTRERYKQQRRPKQTPAQTFAQVAENLQKIRHAERGQNPRQQIRRDAQRSKSEPGQIGTNRSNPIVDFLVRRNADGREVVAVKGQLRHEQQQRQREQRNADDIVKTVFGIGIVAQLSCHACNVASQRAGSKLKLTHRLAASFSLAIWRRLAKLHVPLRAVSSVVEHYLDTVGVGGSKPPPRTIFHSAFRRSGAKITSHSETP